MKKATLTKRGNGWFNGRKKIDKNLGKESWVFGDGVCSNFKMENLGKYNFTMSLKGKYYFTSCGDEFYYLHKQTAKQRRCLGLVSRTIDTLLLKPEIGKKYDIVVERIYADEQEREDKKPKKDKYLGKKYYHMGFSSNTVPELLTVIKETFTFVYLRAEEGSYSHEIRKERFLELLKQRDYSSNPMDVMLTELRLWKSIVKEDTIRLERHEQVVDNIALAIADMA